MRKSVEFPRVRFPSELILRAKEKLPQPREKDDVYLHLNVDVGATGYYYDSIPEWEADYRKEFTFASFSWSHSQAALEVRVFPSRTEVGVKADDRATAELVMGLFEEAAPKWTRPAKVPAARPTPRPRIFIGHGGSGAWRDLNDHLRDKHGFDLQAFETGARAGHTIRDILDELTTTSSFAILVMTAEDEQSDGTFHPRLNVVHELGLFQGKLGFARAIVMLEEGTEEFSNIHGIQQIRFGKGNIRETFGDVVATLRREFGDRR